MKLLNFMKKDQRYMSWEEYKKKLVELQILFLIDKFAKSGINYDYKDLEKTTRDEIARFSQVWGVQ